MANKMEIKLFMGYKISNELRIETNAHLVKPENSAFK